MSGTDQQTQLEQRVSRIETTLMQLLKGPFMDMKNQINALEQEIAALKTQTPPAGAKRTRKPINKVMWQTVQGLLDADPNGNNSWKVISEKSGIPQSTCRKLAKLSAEEVAALPEGEPIVDDSGQDDDTE